MYTVILAGLRARRQQPSSEGMAAVAAYRPLSRARSARTRPALRRLRLDGHPPTPKWEWAGHREYPAAPMPRVVPQRSPIALVGKEESCTTAMSCGSASKRPRSAPRGKCIRAPSPTSHNAPSAPKRIAAHRGTPIPAPPTPTDKKGGPACRKTGAFIARGMPIRDSLRATPTPAAETQPQRLPGK
jgi:hypothetical protein